MKAATSSTRPHDGDAPRSWPLWTTAAFAIALTALTAGAVYLASTRAPALLLDLAAIAGCL